MHLAAWGGKSQDNLHWRNVICILTSANPSMHALARLRGCFRAEEHFIMPQMKMLIHFLSESEWE
jgi:hypothetical protein